MQTQYLGDSCRYCYYNYSREHSETKYFYFYEEGDKIYRYREPGQYWILDENGKETGRVGLKDPYFDLYMDLDISLGDNLIDIGEIDDIRFVEIGGKQDASSHHLGLNLISLTMKGTGLMVSDQIAVRISGMNIQIS